MAEAPKKKVTTVAPKTEFQVQVPITYRRTSKDGKTTASNTYQCTMKCSLGNASVPTEDGLVFAQAEVTFNAQSDISVRTGLMELAGYSKDQDAVIETMKDAFLAGLVELNKQIAATPDYGELKMGIPIPKDAIRVKDTFSEKTLQLSANVAMSYKPVEQMAATHEGRLASAVAEVGISGQ